MMSNFIIDFFGRYLFKFLGVCTLWLLGRVALIFRPNRLVYNFEEIWQMRYDAGDSYLIAIEDHGQKLTGFITFVLLILLMCYLIS